MSDNKENLHENINNNEEVKKKTYFAESQKRYGKKCKIYSVKYVPDEMENVEILESAIVKSGLSANAFIKCAIVEKLERDGFLTVGTAGSDEK